ncbi:MAG: ATP phosphoribosyltransferase [Candidatus Methanomethylicota archaeon]|jgi:ATP phosphoribosyltransferase|uniref:ATP phosphoribosyltransferase n=1 Tax=Thermoproteota archaeon TaxID=2056631 RepID=A0A523BCM7_9CREN|nr:MAG: ATP phosphoribosyltransferase [Candidatus Verstraetearchaeota archaeon]TDA38701.1 MAG: ATP phosphoribosyltransferase [Candidatus Verstraetearchaeota archaeon]
MKGIILAIPSKGRLRKPVMEILERSNIKIIDDDSRVYLTNTTIKGLQILSVRTLDIPTYVYYGIADMGITGKDVIEECGLDVYEIADMKFGNCNLIVAVKEDSPYYDANQLPHGIRVATEFPNLTRRFFNNLGIHVEIITLRGAVEIAPILGLSDCIVDLSSTGETLRKNGLRAIATILRSSARLICNKVSYKTKYEDIKKIIDLLVKSCENINL